MGGGEMSVLFRFMLMLGIRPAAGHAHVAFAGIKHGHAPSLGDTGGANGETGFAVAPVAAVRNKIASVARVFFTSQDKPQEDNTCWA